MAQSGLARLLWEQEVAGSNPAAPTSWLLFRYALTNLLAGLLLLPYGRLR